MDNTIVLRPMEKKDIGQVVALFNKSCESGEVVYSPLSECVFEQDFMKSNMHIFVADNGSKIAGFVHGAQKDVFLPGQTHENTPGYLTLIFVDKAYRRQGIGKKLTEMLADTFSASGKKSVACSESNPLHLSWRIPGTLGHDHNKAPGVDENCAGYGFLQKIGFEAAHHEIAMYMDLKDYVWPENMTQARERLLAEGIYTGRYDAKLGYEFDGMCDRVGSEYWRHVLQMETAAWQKGVPCEDPDLWPDGIRPAGPRPILAATYENHIVGFTGPVDRQKSGRGWFTGICVDPNFGRRSIGEVLFHLLMQEFVNEGAAFTTLFTGLENHAQRIYARAGLRIVCNFAVMEKTLETSAR
jgi:ribosomal protein S18 acetylase RimI-like enzyme